MATPQGKEPGVLRERKWSCDTLLGAVPLLSYNAMASPEHKQDLASMIEALWLAILACESLLMQWPTTSKAAKARISGIQARLKDRAPATPEAAGAPPAGIGG